MLLDAIQAVGRGLAPELAWQRLIQRISGCQAQAHTIDTRTKLERPRRQDFGSLVYLGVGNVRQPAAGNIFSWPQALYCLHDAPVFRGDDGVFIGLCFDGHI